MIIGIGVDVAEVHRYEFDDLKLERFARKVFTEAEVAHAKRYRYPAERLAGAYAAKEATRKAFTHGPFSKRSTRSLSFFFSPYARSRLGFTILLC